MRLRILTAAFAAAFVMATPAGATPGTQYPMPASFYPQALCVHSGWYFGPTGQGQRADYVFGKGLRFTALRHVPSNSWANGGEGGWTNVNSSYGGGMQFTLGTYNTAAGLSHGLLPPARSNADIARLPAAAQIYAAYLTVIVKDHGSWGEWPNTSKACGLG